MIDTLFRYLPLASLARVHDRIAVEAHDFALVTLHRPSNVDDPETLRRLLEVLNTIAKRMPVVFPVHPRTRARLVDLRFTSNGRGVTLTEPLGYIDFLSL